MAAAFEGIKNLYEEIIHNLAENIELGVWADADLQQFEKNPESLTYPAVLVSFGDAIYQYEPDGGYYNGITTFSLKCICKLNNEEDWLVPNEPRDELMSWYDTLNGIYEQVNLQSSEQYSQLMLYNQYQIPNDKYWITVLEFRCNINTLQAVQNSSTLAIGLDMIQQENYFMERMKEFAKKKQV